MKLDEKAIDKMIAEVLEEQTVIVKNIASADKDAVYAAANSNIPRLNVLKDLAKKAGSKDDLEDVDYQWAIDNDGHSGFSKADWTAAKAKLTGGQPPPSPNSNLSDEEKWGYDLANIPADLKKIILFSFKNLSGTRPQDKLKNLAAVAEGVLKEDPAKLDWLDFQAILKNTSDPRHGEAIKAVRIASNTLGATDKHRTALEKILSSQQVAGVINPTDASQETTMSSPVANLSDLYAGGADARQRTPQYIIDLFNSLGLSTTTSFKERIDIINNATKMVADENKHKDFADKYGIGEAIGVLSIMDMMSKIVRTMDAKPAGWVFEHFLAQLANGTQEGDDYGAADYQYGLPSGVGPQNTTGRGQTALNIIGGSAKLLKDNGFEQASLGKSLTNKGDAIVYVVGIKKETQSQIKKPTQGTAKTQLIKMVDIYLTPLWQNSSSGSYRTRAGEATSGGKYKVSDSEYIGTIYLADSAADLADMSEKVLTAINIQLPALYQKMEAFRKQTNSYLTAGRAGSGQESAKAYTELYAAINTVFKAKTEETGVEIQLTGGASTVQTKQQAISESKFASLDQLIAETLRDIKKSRK